jgi:tRNA 2-thiouridine synthesizing protein E
MVCSSGILEKKMFAWNSHEVEVDEDGFIQQPEVWDENLALALARTDGVNELTEAHWKIIHYIRSYFHEFEIAPMIRKMCKETGFSLREIYDLFPSGPAKGACKVAGLPKPTGCV